MEIIEYHRSENPSLWLSQIRHCGWRAGPFLAGLLESGEFYGYLGQGARLLLLTEGRELVSFCTYAERDEIPDEELTPWVGFVHTSPQYRRQRRMGVLLERARELAREDGYPCIYISTDETGLYEKYGAVFWRIMKTRSGADTRVYRMPVIM